VVDNALPGSVRLGLQSFSAVGLFLLALTAFRHSGVSILGVALLLLLNILMGVLTLNKSMVIIPLIFIALAYLMQGVTVHRIAGVTLGLAGTLMLFQPMIGYARGIQAAQYGTLSGGTMSERLTYVADFLSGDRFRAADAGEESLMRLSYMNTATFAVSRYDTDQPADTLRSALISIVPRLIWPDKPETSRVGSDLYYELTGLEGSQTTTTLAADIYWNAGWIGIALVFPLLGMALMAASNVCHRIVAMRNWIMMPFVLLCFRIGLSIDQMFVTGIFAPMFIALVAYWMLKMGASLLISSPSTPARVSLNRPNG
jgi:hypothetical protein